MLKAETPPVFVSLLTERREVQILHPDHEVLPENPYKSTSNGRSQSFTLSIKHLSYFLLGCTVVLTPSLVLIPSCMPKWYPKEEARSGYLTVHSLSLSGPATQFFIVASFQSWLMIQKCRMSGLLNFTSNQVLLLGVYQVKQIF